MRKYAASLCLVLALTLGIALVPTLSLAEEFSFAGPPAFTVTYPGGGTEEEKVSPEQILRIQYPVGFFIAVGVFPIPEGFELKDYAEKLYKPGLEKSQAATAKMSENKEITLADGTKAYYSEISWTHPPTGTPIVTMIVSACKDGKLVYVDAHAYMDFSKYEKIVKSLKFK